MLVYSSTIRWEGGKRIAITFQCAVAYSVNLENYFHENAVCSALQLQYTSCEREKLSPLHPGRLRGNRPGWSWGGSRRKGSTVTKMGPTFTPSGVRVCTMSRFAVGGGKCLDASPKKRVAAIRAPPPWGRRGGEGGTGGPHHTRLARDAVDDAVGVVDRERLPVRNGKGTGWGHAGGGSGVE